MTSQNSIRIYHSDLLRAFQDVTFSVPEGTPLGSITHEIREMVCSYLSDALSFRGNGDIVNEYASLAYAHGWLDAGIFLGYFSGISPFLYLPGDDSIFSKQYGQLKEKALRYEHMLMSAIQSVEIAPESGSPLFHAALTISKRVENVCAQRTDSDGSQTIYGDALGHLSYEYGWLDAGLRAGLYRITNNPGLFTTETTRIL